MDTASPVITAGDRLGLTLFLAASMHAVLILGIAFHPEDPAELRAPPSLEVILVQKRNETAPEKADYLAQVAQTGGGESDLRVRPSNPFSSTEFSETTGLAPQPIKGGNPKIDDELKQPVLTKLHSDHQTLLLEQKLKSETRRQSDQNVDFDLEIAQLTAELSQAREAYAKRPRKMVLTANTLEYLPASYMVEWVEKVERLGNLNYPGQALRDKLEGSLMLEVELKWDGSVVEINVLRSSGYRLLDDAAKQIVKLASPFAPFSPELRQSTDHVEIVRTWQFRNGGVETH
ncbi:MAG TPA: energy transducer TonB [Gammaproteobacteria bacterium]